LTILHDELYELRRHDFERLVDLQFAFMQKEFGFPPPLFWEFADTLYVSFENDQVRSVTWCGKREDSVWTYVERLMLGRGIGLDTANAVLGSPFDYPPDTGWYWTHQEVEARVALEASILHAHLPILIGDDLSLFEEFGGVTQPDSVLIDDPVATFPRRCAERFRFLGNEYGLSPELDGMGSTVLYRGTPVSVRIALLETSYEHESEPEPTITAEIANSPHGKIAPLHRDSVDLEIGDRQGPFSTEYLEQAFDEVERELRERLPLAGGQGG
jgi:hypothetical protein